MDIKAFVSSENPTKDAVLDTIPELIEERRKDAEGKTIVNKFVRGKLLGKGGFAKCFVGVLQSTKATYALKIVDKSTLAKSRAKQKVRNI